MKTFRKIATNPLFIFLLIANFLFVSCSSDAVGGSETGKVNANLTSSAKTKAFTDEEVFMGVIFLEGPVAKKMGDYKDLNFRSFTTNKSEINKILLFQNNVLETIKKEYPNFLSNFRSNVGSGDYYIVKEAITDAYNKVTDATSKLTNISKEKLEATAKNLLSKNNIDGKFSKADLSKTIKQLKSNSTNKQEAIIDIWVGIYIVAVAVVALVAFVVALQQPTDPNQESKFLNDELATSVTLNLSHI